MSSEAFPEGAAGGMGALLEQVTSCLARGEGSHRLALLYYETERAKRATRHAIRNAWRKASAPHLTSDAIWSFLWRPSTESSTSSIMGGGSI